MDDTWKQRFGRVGQFLAESLTSFSLDVVSVVAEYAYELRFRETRPWRGNPLMDDDRVLCTRDGEFIAFSRASDKSFSGFTFCDSSGKALHSIMLKTDLHILDMVVDQDKRVLYALMQDNTGLLSFQSLCTFPFPTTQQSTQDYITSLGMIGGKRLERGINARMMCHLGDFLYLFDQHGINMVRTDGTHVDYIDRPWLLSGVSKSKCSVAVVDAHNMILTDLVDARCTFVTVVHERGQFLEEHIYYAHSFGDIAVSPNGKQLIGVDKGVLHFTDIRQRNYIGRRSEELLPDKPRVCMDRERSLFYVWAPEFRVMYVYEY